MIHVFKSILDYGGPDSIRLSHHLSDDVINKPFPYSANSENGQISVPLPTGNNSAWEFCEGIIESVSTKHGLSYAKTEESQKPPDFKALDGGPGLEVKSFSVRNSDGHLSSPNFDMGEITTLAREPEQFEKYLSFDYVVLAREIEDGRFTIREAYLGKIWDLTGPSPLYPLKCQKKAGKVPDKIRPVTFYNGGTFAEPEDFLKAFLKLVKSYNIDGFSEKPWKSTITEVHSNLFGRSIDWKTEINYRNEAVARAPKL